MEWKGQDKEEMMEALLNRKRTVISDSNLLQ